jgi:hypothetical protein
VSTVKNTMTLRIDPQVQRLIAAVSERKLTTKAEWLRQAIHAQLATEILALEKEQR